MRILFLSVLLSLISAGAFAADESAYDRVIRTNTLRCGYIEWPGYVERDAVTGKMSGMAYDAAEAMGKELNLKIEWSESVGWANYQEGLNTGRYDVACAGLWESGNRIKITLLTRPLFYSAMYAVVRDNDTRFDKTLDSLNDPSVKIESIEADVTEAVKNTLFAKAQNVSVPANVDSAMYMMNVASKKVDAGFFSIETFQGFNKSNPDNKLKLAAGGKPVRVFGNSFAVKAGELQLKTMLDSTIDALINDGTLMRLARAHGAGFIEPVPAYRQ